MKRIPWAVYRVRRFYSASANAIRSVDRVLLGGHMVVYAALEEMSDLVGVPLVRDEQIAGAPVRGGDRDIHRRLWVRRRPDGVYPAMEEFYTVAPAQALDKSMDRFDDTWASHADTLLARLERRCEAAAEVVRHALIRSRFTSAS